MDYKAEFKAARAANDWAKAQEIWKQLCIEAEIEEQSDEIPDGISAELAEYRNKQSQGNFVGGKKI